MKTVLFFIVTLIAFNAVAQSDTIFLSHGHYEVGTIKNKNKTGVWKRYYKDHSIERIQHYQDGKCIGEWKFFLPNGKLANHIRFRDTLLIEFANYYYNPDTKNNRKANAVLSEVGLSQQTFSQLLKRLEVRNDLLRKKITREKEIEESIMIGKAINKQITNREFHHYRVNNSISAIKSKTDSIMLDQFYEICLRAKTSCSLVICDYKGQHEQEFSFEGGKRKHFKLREFYLGKHNVPFSVLTVSGNRSYKKEHILGESTYDVINYYNGTKTIKSKGKIVDGLQEKTWTFYDKRGELTEKIVYKNGQIKKRTFVQ